MFEWRLRQANPWWQDVAAIDKDPVIVKLEHAAVQREPGEVHRFEAGDLVYLLCGPRRVGKTTLLKSEIRRLLRGGAPPGSVMYFSLDSEAQASDIYAVVDEYFTVQPCTSRRFMFLDEITGVKNWHKAVKNMLDIGRLRGCTVVITGSQVTGVIGPAGHLAGRRGEPKSGSLDRVLEPMSFREYAVAMDPDIRAEAARLSLGDERTRTGAVRRMFDGELPDAARELIQFKDALNVHLRNYLLTGGMPSIVNLLAGKDAVPDKAYRDYMGVARADIMAAGLRYGAVRNLMPYVAESVGSPASWASLRKDTGIESPQTIENYAETLSEMFLLRVVYRYDASSDRPKTNALKKVYFRDPFFYHAWRDRKAKNMFDRSADTVDDPQRAGHLVEQVVSEHIRRLASALDGHVDPLGYDDDVFYWKSGRGREVDFVLRVGGRGGRLVPIEVKWQRRIRRDDMYGIFDFRKATGSNGRGGIVLSRDDWREQSGLVVVPASVFGLLV